MSEDDLIGVVAQALGDFFGDRSFCIRTVDGETHALLSLYAKGNLKQEARTRLHLKESAVRKLHLGRRIRESPRVAVGSEHVLVFEDTEVGLGVPLVAGGQLLGHIALEGPAGAFENLEADERLTIALANQLAVALRNVRLLAEARYLRGYLEKVIEQAGALVLAVDRQGKIAIFNRACQQLSGFSRAEAQGIALVELIVPEERERLSSLLREALKGYSAENVELTVLRRDGGRHPIAVNAAPILGKDGIVESVVLIGHDLSRLMELERQVVRAEKLATLGQLATAVVHELNNPLTSIVAYADALRGRLSLIGTEADEAKAGKIIEATERILRFTRDLLTYARPGTETTARLDLREVIDESLGLCQHTVERAGVQISVSWDPAIPWIVGHRSRLQQVFVNLITNACQAMRPSGGTLEIIGRMRDETVEVRLADSGPGLAPEIAERIFEPFFSTKAPGQGTGLGLSIVKEIVARHSGSIEVESSPGEGATFVLRLPV
jgi:PAS domain S-box-containing protein